MKAKCLICQKPFESLIIDPEIAWREVYVGLLKHVVNKHPADNVRVQKMLMEASLLCTAIVSVGEFVDLEEPLHPWLQGHFDEMGAKLMDILGYDDDEEEEEETEEPDKTGKIVDIDSKTDEPTNVVPINPAN